MKKFIAIATMLFSFSYIGISGAAWNTEGVGGFNSVHIYTPATSSPIGEGRSLLVVLHGCAQSYNAYKGANLDKAAEEYGMVVAVPDAKFKQGISCWGYWTGRPSRTSGDYKNLLSMVDSLLARSDMDIDPAQVYIAGLSSGGAFTMQTGCLAPDVFAGMGIDAGPSAGTGMMDAMGPKGGTVASTKSNCQSYAGSNASHFSTQITSVAYGTGDYTVNQGYGLQNAEAMAQIYGVSKGGASTIDKGVTETVWGDRVAMIAMTGVSHAWPGGSGASGSYIDGSSINYASYLGDFFAKNNMRVGNNDYNGSTGNDSGNSTDTGSDDTGTDSGIDLGNGIDLGTGIDLGAGTDFDWSDWLGGAGDAGTGFDWGDWTGGTGDAGTGFDWGDWTGGTGDAGTGFDWGDWTGGTGDAGTDFDWSDWLGGAGDAGDTDTGFDWGDWTGGTGDSDAGDAGTDFDWGDWIGGGDQADDEEDAEEDDTAVSDDSEEAEEVELAENTSSSGGGGGSLGTLLLAAMILVGLRKKRG